MYKKLYYVLLMLSLFVCNNVYISYGSTHFKDDPCNISYQVLTSRVNYSIEEESVSRCKELAQQGSAQAQLELGDRYDLGLGVQRHSSLAAFWYIQAAQQGLVEAQYNIALKYDNGDGVEHNKEMAFIWFMKAAQQNDDQAQYSVATMFECGEGVLQNNVLACYWYHVSAKQGNELAREALQRLNSEALEKNTADFVDISFWKM